MAITDLGLLGSGSSITSGTSLAVTASSAIPAGTLLVLAVTFDNHASTTASTVALSAFAGTAWTQRGSTTGSGVTTTAGSGVWAATYTLRTPVALNSGQTITTLTFGSAVVSKIVRVRGFSGVQNVLRGNAAAASSTSGVPTITTAAPLAGDLVVGTIHGETNTAPVGDTDTVNGSWSSIVGSSTTGGSAAVNTAVGIQHKVVTATGSQTFNATTGGDSVAIVFTLQPYPDPTVTQAAYRFYADDAGEATSTALAAQDTAYAADLNLVGDLKLRLRTRLQSTNVTDLPDTDSWQLQYEVNASGTWVNVTTSSSVVAGYDAANLTDAAATTNRLGAGTGSFVAGEISEDGLADGVGWSANNYTELVYSLTLKQADLAHGDTIRFRVLRNDATTGLTYTATPTITASRPAVAVTQASYRFYADGTEAGSLALAAQDTAYAADVSNSDARVLLRTRLQSTTSAPLAATDDWQLQYERNASGTWVDVTTVPVLLDSYDATNKDSGNPIDTTENDVVGQSVVGTGTPITRLSFYLQRTLNTTPNGTYSAAIYPAGANAAKPDRFATPLATATTALDPTTLPNGGAYNWCDFDFDGNLVLTAGTTYWVALTTTNTAFNTVSAGIDKTSATHPGDMATHSAVGSSWTSSPADQDLIFRAYVSPSTIVPFNSANLTDQAATTNRLGAGTGSFAAGTIAEDGLADNTGWAGNSYTELLYPLTLKTADLADADTLRFRVLRNGATTGLTYTATPTITVSKAAGTNFTGAAALSGSSSVTAAGTPKPTTSPSLSGSGTPTGAATPALVATATLTGSGTLTAAATPVASDSAAISGSGTLSAAGAARAATTGSLAGSGTVTAATVPFWVDSVTLTGSGTTTQSATPALAGTVNLAGSGGTTVSAAPSWSATTALTGSGTATAVASLAWVDSGPLTGSGTLVASGTSAASGAAATLTGSGTTTSSAAPAASGPAAPSGAGTLAAAATPAASGAATLTGSGALTGSGTSAVPAPAALSGSGTLVASATPAASATAALTGSGTASAVTAPAWVDSVALSGSGSTTQSAAPNWSTAAALTGSGTATGAGAALSSIGLRGTFGAAASVSGAVASAALPAGSAAGDVAVVIASINAGSTITATTPTGWTLLDGPSNSGSLIQSYLFGKVLDGSETTITVRWSSNGRWTLAGGVISGAAGLPGVTERLDTATDTALEVPAFTPAADNSLALSLLGANFQSGITSGVATSPTGWTLRVEAPTTLTGVVMETAVFSRQLGASTAGVTQSAVSGTWNGAARNVGWVTAFAPGVAPTLGSATLTGSGTLAAAATPEVAASASASGSGTLAPAGAPAAAAAGSLTGSGTASTAGVVATSATATLSGSGVLTTSGAPGGVAASNLDGSGAVTAAGRLASTAANALSGSGALTASGTSAVPAPAAFTGSGASSTQAAPAVTAATTLAGSGTLAAAGTATSAAVDLTGAGSVVVSGTPSIDAAADLTGVGAPAGSGIPGVTTTAELAGSGSLTAQATATSSDSAALTGSGALGSQGAAALTQQVALTGQGLLTGTGTGTASNTEVTGTAVLAGSGSLAATGSPTGTGAAAPTGTGTLTAVGRLNLTGTGALDGSGALAATRVLPGPASTGAVAGQGSASTETTPKARGSVDLVASGSLVATAHLVALADQASLNSLGALTAAGAVGFIDSADLSGVGELRAFTPRNITVTATARTAWTGDVATRSRRADARVGAWAGDLPTPPWQADTRSRAWTARSYE